MQCKNGLCPGRSIVNRKQAVHAICNDLRDLIHRDGDLIEQIVCQAQDLDARGDDQLRSEISALNRKVAVLASKASDLYELAGQGSEDDRAEVMVKVRATQAERTTARHELSRLDRALAGSEATITPGAVRSILADLTRLLEYAADGKLGPDAVYTAASVFGSLVGGRIWVHVERRPNRKRANVRGVIRPQLINTVCDAVK